MNVFNVHVNVSRDGHVFATHYNPGKFLNAAEDKASLDNEQSTVGIQTPSTGFSSARSPALISPTHRDVQQKSAIAGHPGRSLRHHSALVRVSTSFMPVGSTVKVKLGQLRLAAPSLGNCRNETASAATQHAAPRGRAVSRERSSTLLKLVLWRLSPRGGVARVVHAGRLVRHNSGGVADAFDGRVARATIPKAVSARSWTRWSMRSRSAWRPR